MLSVTFTPTDSADYKTVMDTTTLVVTAGTPTITWAVPAVITAGTPLGSAQLDATAAVAGSFTYTPAAGTILSAGSTRLLVVSFAPTDIADYTSASAQRPDHRPTPMIRVPPRHHGNRQHHPVEEGVKGDHRRLRRGAGSGIGGRPFSVQRSRGGDDASQDPLHQARAHQRDQLRRHLPRDDQPRHTLQGSGEGDGPRRHPRHHRRLEQRRLLSDRSLMKRPEGWPGRDPAEAGLIGRRGMRRARSKLVSALIDARQGVRP